MAATAGDAGAAEHTTSTDVDVTVCGVTAAIGGEHHVECTEAEPQVQIEVAVTVTEPVTDLAGGNDTRTVITAPVEVRGVTVAVDAAVATDCAQPAPDPGATPAVEPATAAAAAPVEVCGVGAAVAAANATRCDRGESTPPPEEHRRVADVAAPVEVCGVAVTADGSNSVECSEPARHPAPGSTVGVISPVRVCGVGATIAGGSNLECVTVAEVGTTNPATQTPEPDPFDGPDGTWIPGEDAEVAALTGATSPTAEASGAAAAQPPLARTGGGHREVGAAAVAAILAGLVLRRRREPGRLV